MRALVTLAIGEEYQRRFERCCRDSWSDYARRHGYELIVIDDRLDRSERAVSRPVHWQKCLVFQHPAVTRFRQVAWLDSDIAINARDAPPVFAGVDEDRVGAVDEFRAPDATTYRRALAALYLRLRMRGVGFMHNLTPEQFYRNRRLPEHDAVVQTGVLVCSPDRHGELMRSIYDAHEHNDTPGSLMEMAAVSHELLKRGLVQWIDHRFNRSVLLGIEEHRLRQADAGRRIVPAAAGAVRPIIAQLLSDCYFLHFAGAQELMDHL